MLEFVLNLQRKLFLGEPRHLVMVERLLGKPGLGRKQSSLVRAVALVHIQVRCSHLKILALKRRNLLQLVLLQKLSADRPRAHEFLQLHQMEFLCKPSSSHKTIHYLDLALYRRNSH
jgi:hypothetical protein